LKVGIIFTKVEMTFSEGSGEQANQRKAGGKPRNSEGISSV
jgi:hypothetical protein